MTYTTYSQGDLLRYTAHNQQLSLEIEVLRRANRENLLKEIKVALPQYPIYFHKDPVVILMELDIQGYNFTNFVPREGKIPSYTRPSSLTCENFPDEHISIKTIPEFISQVISNPDIDDPLKLLFDINQTLQEQMQE